MEKERVVITGLGTINAIAGNAPEFSAALGQGVCGIGPVTVFSTTDFRTRTGGEVKNFVPGKMLPRQFSIKRMSRSDLMAMAAALEALRDAGLFPFPEELQADAGVVIGGGAGGMLEGEAAYRQYLKGGGNGVRYSQFSSFCCASSADHIASNFGLMGPKTTFMTACSSGATAIGYAGDLIREGIAPLVVSGGAEPLSRVTYAAFNALQAVDTAYCKPFDKNRQGLSLGEGAGIMILEALSHAQKRGARIYGELLGYGVSCDSYHMTAPDPQASGAVRCITAALQDSNVSPDRVDAINAHGTATPANDLMETRGIKAVFGKRAYNIPVSATKSMTGHTLGAAGAIEGVASVLGIFGRFVPPTIHLTERDPECDLDYVAEGSREAEADIVLSNSFAFGGNNTAIVLGRYTPKGIVHE
ncbi:MAG: beta-ketoacyl-[acyl-carrier-protein] synthase family protein [Desulfobacterales bacterium]|nr:beta-ketoacyl-[acyl-carrier-protein] synthase family protein [Desulfobacterales bacterium]